MAGRGAHRRADFTIRRRTLLAMLVGVVVLAAVVLVAVGLRAPDTGLTPPASARPVAAPVAPLAPPVAPVGSGGPPAPALDPPVVQSRVDDVVHARPLQFVGNSTMMVPTGPEAIDQVAWLLLTSPGTTVTVNGYTAPVDGDPARCQSLSEQRADLVAGRLESYGVAPTRLHTRGLSHRDPAGSWEASRRVEFSVA